MSIGPPRPLTKGGDEEESGSDCNDKWTVHPDFAGECAFHLSRTQWVQFDAHEGVAGQSGGFDLTTKAEEDVLKVADAWSTAAEAYANAGPNTALETPRPTEEENPTAEESTLIPELNTRTPNVGLADGEQITTAKATNVDATKAPSVKAGDVSATTTPHAESRPTPSRVKVEPAIAGQPRKADAVDADAAVTTSDAKHARKKKKAAVTVLAGGVPISSTNLRLLGLRLIQIQVFRQRVLKWSHKSILSRLKCLKYTNKSRNTPAWWSVQMELQLFRGSHASVCVHAIGCWGSG